MTAALVTTIIPVFNRPALLRAAVASVIAQTHRPIEVIIVDDGSTDATSAVADELAREHEGIVRVIHTANGGPGSAREAGRATARGAYIQHLDSDDVLLPHKFELQVAALESAPRCGAAYGWTRFRYRGGEVEPRPWKRSGEPIPTMFPSMLTSRWWDTPTPLYRASVIAVAGPWTGLRVEEDWEYDCRIAARGVDLVYVEAWVCEVRQHEAPYDKPEHLRDRALAHLLILDHARTFGLSNDSPEMQFFARDLFHLARQCGAAGLGGESRRLVNAARSISRARDLRLYALAGTVVGWTRAARVANRLWSGK